MECSCPGLSTTKWWDGAAKITKEIGTIITLPPDAHMVHVSSVDTDWYLATKNRITGFPQPEYYWGCSLDTDLRYPLWPLRASEDVQRIQKINAKPIYTVGWRRYWPSLRACIKTTKASFSKPGAIDSSRPTGHCAKEASRWVACKKLVLRSSDNNPRRKKFLHCSALFN